jgi:hypothetical protein
MIGLKPFIPLLLILGILELTIGLYIETYLLGVAFSIGRSIRDMLPKEKKKGKQKINRVKQ